MNNNGNKNRIIGVVFCIVGAYGVECKTRAKHNAILKMFASFNIIFCEDKIN